MFWLLFSFFLWLSLFKFDKGSAVLFKSRGGGGKQPSYTPPPPPKLPTADELYQSALKYSQANFPQGLKARETALADLALGQKYYEGFQPTSFEQALADQYFKDVWPGTEKTILGTLSRTGMAYSPITAELLGRERGQLGTDIGQYLANQGNQRAQYSLGNRLNIDPNAYTSPFVETGMNQSTNQAKLDYDYAQQIVKNQYQDALNKYKQKQARNKTLATIGGLGLGALTGGLLLPALGIGGAGALAGAGPAALESFVASGALPASFGGALTGAAFGGSLGGMFGEGPPPISFGDALSFSQRNNVMPVYGRDRYGLDKFKSKY